MKNEYDKINALQEKKFFCIDVFHRDIDGARFFELEKIYLENYLEDFSRKITKIALQIISKFGVEIYLTEFPEEGEVSKYSKLVDRNIGEMKMQEIADIIKFVTANDISSVQILVPEFDFLFSINGEFQVVVFNIDNDQLDFVKEIVEKEGLYFYQPQE